MSLEYQFSCGHIGKGKFCHLCEQIKRGELIVAQRFVDNVSQDKEDHPVRNPKYISESKVVEHILGKTWQGRDNRSKGTIIEEYCKRTGTSLFAIRKEISK